VIILRFVRHNDLCSDIIIRGVGGSYSHVEAVTPDGRYLGAFGEGYKDIPAGVSARPMDYDAGKWADEKFMLLPADDSMSGVFYHYLRACIGEPYDWGGLSVFTHVGDLHMEHHVFCSAFMTDGLRGCLYFPTSLPIRAHDVSPRDLDLGLTMRPDTRVITPDDPVFRSHILVEKTEA
jgi:hypothetical protein